MFKQATPGTTITFVRTTDKVFELYFWHQNYLIEWKLKPHSFNFVYKFN